MTTLAWTLVHFLWQGAIIGLVAWLTLRTRLSAPARYAAGVIALAAFASAPVITLMITSRPPGAAGIAAPASLLASMTRPEDASRATAVAPAIGASDSAAIQGRRVVEAYLPYILLIWSVGVAAMSARLAVRWGLARRLAHRGRAMAAADLQAMATRLAGRLALDRVVRLLQSTDVAVPVVVGWLRPVVILPTAAISGLPPSHIEALLAHELAHVRRHDYLVNLLQSMVETVLFYHPAVWWVSREVRVAREECCDDLAVAVCDRLEYVTALTNLAALATHPRIALAATDGSLVARVRRLLGDTPRDQGQTTGWAAAVMGILIVGAVPAGLALSPQQQTPVAPGVTVEVRTTPREMPPATPVIEVPVVVASPVEAPQTTLKPVPVEQVLSEKLRAEQEAKEKLRAELEAAVTSKETAAELQLKELEKDLTQLHEKQVALERSKLSEEFDDQLTSIRQRYELMRSELDRVKRQFAVGLVGSSQVKEVEVQFLELERKLAATQKDKEYRITDFELQQQKMKKQQEYEEIRVKLQQRLNERADAEAELKARIAQKDLAKLVEQPQAKVVEQRQVKFESAPRTLSVSIPGASSLTLTPAPQPYTSGGPAVFVHLDAARSTAKSADGRIISGFKFISWREGDRYRVMVLAMVPRIGEKNAFVTDAKLTELVDFATYLVGPGLDVSVPQLDAAGRGAITLRVK